MEKEEDKFIETLRNVLAEINSNPVRSFMTPEQVAKELNVHAEKIRRMCRAKTIKSYLIGRYIRIERKDLDAYIKSRALLK